MTRHAREVQARCIVEIEQTPDSFHAFSVPLDVAVEPGDEVLIHDAPTGVAWNESLSRECRITVRRAGPLRRAWTRASGVFAITELYEVGFEPGEHA